MNFFRKKRYLIAAGAAALCSFFFLSAAKTDFDVGRNLEVMFNLFREVHMNYVDDTDPDQLMQRAAAGMLRELDPYTEFLSEKDMENFEVMTTGKYGGIGSLIRQKGEWVVIAQPYQGFAADKAGLKIGDKILAVNGFEARNATTAQISDRMKGDPGTLLKIKVERFRDGTVEELEIVRERISMSGIAYYGMLNDTVGYIAHEDFTDECSNDMRDAIMELKKQGMTALVYDLRNNGGGVLQEAVKIVGMFVPKDSEVVQVRGRSERGASYRTPSAPIAPDLPLTVLIGRNSASAAEIVSGALQDYDRAVIVGERSFGKGLVQSPRPLGYNNYVKMTTAKYYIPSGRCIQAIDYSHRDAEGRVSHVPDSLIREFLTLRNGRKVYDGAGIMPDIASPQPTFSLFAAALYGNSYLEDFALEYIRKHRFEPVAIDSFSLGDDGYAEFIDFMADKEVEYDSETKMALEVLKRTAEKEFMAEAIAPQLEELTQKITKNKNEELIRLQPEITELIEDNILLYHHYSAGMIRHRIQHDPTVSQALGILTQPTEYHRILASQDTRRN
ncbi:MAG: S41 family peptidase [Rikenellaceae bacterium]|nr:S41 family peptidase [Rikenellaceae bacterium]